MKRILALLAGVLAMLLAMAAPAHADAVADAVAALRSDRLHVAPGVTTKIDREAVRRAIGDAPIYVAVLPEQYQSTVVDTAQRIGEGLGVSGTVGVVAGRQFGAASNVLCPGSVAPIVQLVLADNRDQLQQTGELTKLLSDFAADVTTAPRRGRDCAGGGGTTTSGSSGESGSALPWVIGLGTIGALGAAGGGAYVLSRRRRRLRELEGRRAEVLSLYDRLGGDVSHLDPKDDPVARQALADASERYTATGSLLSHADTEGEYDAARRTALEGLQAARTARKALGLDEGPELPPIAPTYGEQLTERREVAVGGKTYQGYPDYTPGAPYYYGGGGGVPGGWYSFPFWETLLLSSVLTGGFGGWGGGGGYDAGYDRGYEAGQDSAEDRSGSSGGGGWDTGGGGGGWDSGGGGWGGGGGGGGGDSGGGGW